MNKRTPTGREIWLIRTARIEQEFRTSPIERFWSYVNKQTQPDDCWIWFGATNAKDYGEFRVDGKLMRSHRLVWEWVFGPIPEGKMICHECDNPSCVNPAHLYVGDARTNALDRDAQGRSRWDK